MTSLVRPQLPDEGGEVAFGPVLVDGLVRVLESFAAGEEVLSVQVVVGVGVVVVVLDDVTVTQQSQLQHLDGSVEVDFVACALETLLVDDVFELLFVGGVIHYIKFTA